MATIPPLALLFEFGLSFVAAALVVFLLGSVLELNIPSFFGMIWRCLCLAGVTVAVSVASALGYLPIPFIDVLVTAVAVVFLFGLDMPDDWIMVVAFIVAYAIAQWAIALFGAIILVESMQTASASLELPRTVAAAVRAA